MASPHQGILVSSIVLIVVAVVVFVLAVAGVLFNAATSPMDLGLYTVTIVLLGFGVGGLLLRKAKLREAAARGY